MRGTCFKHTPNLTYAELQIKNARPALELMSIEWESRSSNEATRWFGSFLNIFDTAPSPLKNSTMVQRMPQSTFSVHIKSMTIPTSTCQLVGRMTSIYFENHDFSRKHSGALGAPICARFMITLPSLFTAMLNPPRSLDAKLRTGDVSALHFSRQRSI